MKNVHPLQSKEPYAVPDSAFEVLVSRILANMHRHIVTELFAQLVELLANLNGFGIPQALFR